MVHSLVPPGARTASVTTSAGTLHVLHASPGHSPGSDLPSSPQRAGLSSSPDHQPHPSSPDHQPHPAQAPNGTPLPLVLIHGGGSDSSAISWYHLFGPLGRTRPVWAIDLPAFGGSIDVPPVGGPDAMADVLAEALDRLRVGPAIVIGISMGGDVALHAARRHPDKVAGLVLIGPGGLTPRLRGRLAHTAIWAMTLLPDPILLPLSQASARFAVTAMRAQVTKPDSLPQEVVDEFVRLARHPADGMGYGRYNQATVGPRRMLNDSSAHTYRITAPTLLVHGLSDAMVDPEDSRRAAERMPHARLVEIPDCGHWSQLDEPDLFLTHLREFLADVDARPRPDSRRHH